MVLKKGFTMGYNTLISNKLENVVINIFEGEKIRLRKIDIPKLIHLLCELTNNSSPSFRDIALQYSMKYGRHISKVAFFNFMENYLEKILIRIIFWFLYESNNRENIEPFGRILIQDSTVIKFPDSAPDKYLGLNKRKGCKIQTHYDILRNKYIDMEITPFNVNEQKYSYEIKNILRENDLIIRDLGYFNSEVMRYIIDANAYFISKIQTKTAFYDKNGKKFNLLEKLRKEQEIDMKVYATNNKIPVRIVARKVSEEIANRRRQKKKADRKSNPDKRSLAILGWDILITNIFDSSIDMDTLFNLYRLRWKIEIIFKTWKSYLNITSFHQRISGKQVILYSLCRLINILLLDKIIISPLFNKAKKLNFQDRISYQSLVRNLSKNFVNIIYAPSIKELWKIIKKIIKYSLYEKRKGKLNLKMLETITLNNLFYKNKLTL